MTSGLFIAGTGTGVGKTFVACTLLREYAAAGARWVPFKPFVSGQEADGTYEDIERLRQASGLALADVELAPCRFPLSMAPAAAAEKLGQSVDWQAIEARFAALRAGSLPILVESAGGVCVPLGVRNGKIWTNVDLAAWMDLPAILVARAGLGTINHTVLSVKALQAAGVEVRQVVLNGGSEAQAEAGLVASNREWIFRMTGVETRIAGDAENQCPSARSNTVA